MGHERAECGGRPARWGAPLAGTAVAVTLLACAGAASATPAVQGGPVQLSAEADLQIIGPSHGSAAGQAVDGAGDVNGDGYQDLIVAAQGAGEVYVLFGPFDEPTIELHDFAGDGFRIAGGHWIGLGAAAAGAGDVDGDGYDDVIVADWNIDGRSWVIYGGPAPTDVDVRSLGGAGFMMDGAPAVGSGAISSAASGAGDVNGDGYDDVVVGATGGVDGDWSARGNAYVIFGGPTRPTALDLSDLGDAGATIVGVPQGQLGWAVDGAGDFDGDGLDDVVVGAEGAPAVYVIDGSALQPGAVIDTGALGEDGTVIFGEPAMAMLGTSVSGAGDFDGDGLDDVVLGVSGDAAAVVFGTASATHVSAADPGAAGITLTDPSSAWLGQAVAGAGDVNGDGLGDVVVGDAHTAFHGPESGSAYLIFGDASPADVDVTSLTGGLGFRMDGEQGSYTGLGLGGAGDLDSDGVDDVIVGSDLAMIDGARTGAAYVVDGFAPEISVSPSGPLAFSAYVGATQSQALTVSNGVASPLSGGVLDVSGAGAGAFSVGTSTCTDGTSSVPPALAVPASGECTFEVTYAPAAAGTQTATLTLVSAIGTPDVTVQLTGTAPATPLPPEPAPVPEPSTPVAPGPQPTAGGDCRPSQGTPRSAPPGWLRAGRLLCRVPVALRGLEDLSVTRAATRRSAEGRARTLRRRGLVVRILPAVGGYVVVSGERRHHHEPHRGRRGR